MRRIIVLSVSVVALVASAAGATCVIHDDGSGDYPTIQDAIAAGCTDIVLTDGVFRGEGNRDIDFGGVGITVRSQSGDPELCVIDCEGSMENPHRGFYMPSGATTAAVIQGLTITNGFAVGGDPEGCGGGIVCFSSSPTVIDCRLVNNWADYGGGGISCQSGSCPGIYHTVFHGNEGEGQGGGLECMDGSRATVVSCSFSQNNAYHGGGIYSHGYSPLTVDGCSFSDNWCTSGGGGMYCGTGLQSELTGCTFLDNVAGTHGGGVFCAYNSDPILTDCLFAGNSSVKGGGIATSYGAPSLDRCVFYANTASGSSWGDGGGLYLRYGPASVLSNCTLSGNSGGTQAGGIYCRDGAAVIAENTIIGFSTDGAAVYCGSDGAATLTCCDVFGNAGGDWAGCIADQYLVDGNFSEDPLFCLGDNLGEPYSLHGGSPCLPENSPCGALVGAFDEGCEPVTPVENASWGALKALFR